MESHEPDLLDEIHDHNKVLQIQQDYTRYEFDPGTRQLLDFAVKLTLNIKEMDKADVEAMRTSGFSDEDILDAVNLIGYFNYSNRVMDALGIQPETNMRYGRK